MGLLKTVFEVNLGLFGASRGGFVFPLPFPFRATRALKLTSLVIVLLIEERRRRC
jgi:hypothetical protein